MGLSRSHMAFPPQAFSTHDGRVYSEWEVHKLAAAGLRRFALGGVIGSLMLIALEAVAARGGYATALLPSWVSRGALLLSTASSAAFFGLALVRKVEVQRPMALTAMLAFALAAVGSLSALAAGGFEGPLSFGLLPVVWLWALTMPGGIKPALAPLFGGLAAHAAVLVVGGQPVPLSAAVAVAGWLIVGTGLSLATAAVVEHWRSRAADLSQHDWLTGALSRRYLEERLDALCSQRQRSLAPVSLVMFDVDRFKSINDSWGRGVGDEVLELLVSGIKSEIRASDFIGRYGGDEFLLVLDECEGNAAMSLLDRLRERFASKPMNVADGSQVRVSFAAGIVSVGPGDALVMKDLLRNVEKALEHSKDTSRNRTAMAPPPPPIDAGPDGHTTQLIR